MSSFECGFDPLLNSRVPFSLKFFLVSIIFLIFDVELVLLLPLGYIYTVYNRLVIRVIGVLIILVLIIGLVYEWGRGILNWEGS